MYVAKKRDYLKSPLNNLLSTLNPLKLKSDMKNALKKIIEKTPFNTVARKLVNSLKIKKQSEWSKRVTRDENYTEALLKKVIKKDSNCLDIGANVGKFLISFLKLAPDGKHYAFEPLEKMSDSLKQKFPTVEVFNVALSDYSGKSEFFEVPGREAWSGLKTQHYPQNIIPIKKIVEVKKLDDTIPSNLRVDFIKIDVEGAELGVFKGAEQTIKKWKPTILFENAKIHNENYETNAEMIYDFLVNKCNLKIYNLKMSEVFTKNEFVKVYEESFQTNYDSKAQTNFVAIP